MCSPSVSIYTQHTLLNKLYSLSMNLCVRESARVTADDAVFFVVCLISQFLHKILHIFDTHDGIN